MSTRETQKLVAQKAANYVENGMSVGLGSGRTTSLLIELLGEKVKEGLQIKAIASSIRSEALARQVGIPLTDFSQIQTLDLTIDGANEVDPQGGLIKGGGGSLLREKMIASISTRFLVIVDESKLVARLGKFPLPVEVVAFGWQLTKNKIERQGCSSSLRLADNKPFITDNGNYLLDCDFEQILQPEKLYTALKLMVGVVEVGLFTNMSPQVLVAYSDGRVTIR